MGYTRLLRTLVSPRQHWNIGIINKPIQSFVDDVNYKVKWFPNPDKETHYLADPFGAIIDGKKYVFMEDYDHSERRGKISYVSIDKNNNPSEIKTAFEKSYHISYPYLFNHNGDVYCIPETYVANNLTLYHLKSPSDWEKKHTIIEGIDVVDASLIQYNGLWWIFFTRVYDDSNLYIWYSEDLFSTWQPHENNPVKSNIRSSRPGGKMFIHDGKLYRPTQDCENHYGANIVVNQVVTISPTEFAEKTVSIIAPNEHKLGGVHTLSSLGEITLIDGFKSIGRDRMWLKDKISSVFKYLLTKQTKPGAETHG